MNIQFKWRVPESQHEWKRHKGDQILVWREERKGGWSKLYDPPIGLFRDFAEVNAGRTEASPREILKFGDTYGDILGVPGDSFYGPPIEGLPKPIIRSHATLKTWQHTIQQMRWAVRLWDQCNDASLLKA